MTGVKLSKGSVRFDRIVDTFMTGDFRGEMAMPSEAMRPEFDPTVGAAIHALEETWGDYRAGLLEALGDAADEPRLEFAAEHNTANARVLESASQALRFQASVAITI